MTTKKTDELFSLYKQFAESQHRQQVMVAVVLSAVITVATVLYTWITWESVVAKREANELQRQVLELQKASPASKVALTRRSDARSGIQASTEPHRAPSRAHSNELERIGGRQALIDSRVVPAAGNSSPPSPHTWGTHSVMLDRPGRQ
jgi:hypothetical protein